MTGIKKALEKTPTEELEQLQGLLQTVEKWVKTLRQDIEEELRLRMFSGRMDFEP